jgi:dipeptidase D
MTELSKLSGLKPRRLWHHFSALCAIPRISKHEAQVIEHIKAQAERWGHETKIDAAGNLIVRKRASKGMEESAGIILQSHVDMVAQKTTESRHDFLKDPIKTLVEGDWLRAEGTTLGADNGIGVAAIMAVLEDVSLQHGPLEALLTVDEEAGMTGAFNLEPGLLQGDILFNLDSEDEGEIFVGCAGGQDVEISLALIKEAWPRQSTAIKISIDGLKGGHSGVDIHRGRSNANKLLTKILQPLLSLQGVSIAALEGGTLRNAIPRNATATICVPRDLIAQLKSELARQWAKQLDSLSAEENSVSLHICETAAMAQIINASQAKAWFDALASCPDGVANMLEGMPDVVECSSNLGVMQLLDDVLSAKFLVRSCLDSSRDQLCQSIASAFATTGATVTSGHGYPGWQPDYKSALLKRFCEIYQQEFDKALAVKVIHAGLECGLFHKHYPHWRMLSFGPTIRFPHSPDEKVSIESVERFWRFLLLALQQNYPA